LARASSGSARRRRRPLDRRPFPSR
jgi:hypothetical protein